MIDEWIDLGGGRGFTLIESSDSKGAMASTMVWSDLMKMEVVPVIETAELLEGLKK